jgi:hypothetical protein
VGEALVNPERLRRALGRRNEATHPVELPDPEPPSFVVRTDTGDRITTVSGGYRHRETLEPVRRTPEERYLLDDLTEVGPSLVEQVCDVCEEPGTDAYGGDDVLAEFIGDAGEAVLAHGQCGIDQGWELA